MADRKRGRVPRRARQPHGRPRQPAADGTGRAGRRDRRLHQRSRWAATCSATSVRRALRRRHPRETTSPVSDPDSTGQVMQFNVVPAVGVDDSTPPQFLAAARDHAAACGDADAAAGAHREDGRWPRRRRRRGRGPARGAARHRGCDGIADAEALDGCGEREPRRRCYRGLGVLQHHRPTPTRCTSTRSCSRS